mmetsp:Transcript_12360/g.29456  ORF Transcript_12360/g.29456 Transcript_12360/m.29456 type:complete len:217 (-) Transcript_12360:315-965(-)
MTSALCKIRLEAFHLSVLSLGSAHSASTRLLSKQLSSAELIRSDFASRMTPMPLAYALSAMLSTATLLCEVTSIGPMPMAVQIRMTSTDTCVLPVPGGPWITVRRLCTAASTASRCDLVNFFISRAPFIFSSTFMVILSSPARFSDASERSFNALMLHGLCWSFLPSRTMSSLASPKAPRCFILPRILAAHESRISPPTPLKGSNSHKGNRLSALT